MLKPEIIVRNLKQDGTFSDILSDSNQLDWAVINGSDHDVIYMYKGDHDFYVGQTKHFEQRNRQHYAQDDAFKSGLFNQVAVVFGSEIKGNLDALESLLIEDVEKDNQYNYKGNVPLHKVNRTIGNSAPSRNDIARDIEPKVWKLLHDKGFVNAENLLSVRRKVLTSGPGGTYPTQNELRVVDTIMNDPNNNYVVQGYAGTGKTFIINLLADRLSQQHLNVAVAVKGNVVREYRNRFSTWALPVDVKKHSEVSCSDEHYDVILVDEAHRLHRPYGKTKGMEGNLWKNLEDKRVDNELELIKLKADRLILMYDPLQTLRPDDITPEQFGQGTSDWQRIRLSHQVRINPIEGFGTRTLGDEFVAGLIDFLGYPASVSPGITYDKGIFTEYKNTQNHSSPYFGICDSIAELFDYINHKQNLYPNTVNRVVAGYVRQWKSKNNPEAFDWVEGDNMWRWNSTYEGWVTPVSSSIAMQKNKRARYREEIGSVHAVQGEDLNYVGVIIGKDLGIDANGRLVGVKAKYCDRNGTPSKTDFDQDTFDRFIKNNYFMLMTRAIDGIRVYFEDPNMRAKFENFMNNESEVTQ